MTTSDILPTVTISRSTSEFRRDMDSYTQVAYQAHENDEAVVCVVHEPSSTANFFGNLHPCGRLYEQPFDLEKARKEHQQFVCAMEDAGVKVVKVEEILTRDCFKGNNFDIKKRIRLEDLAMKQLKYRLTPTCDAASLTQEESFYLSNDYKRECVEQMNAYQLIQVIMTCPVVTLDRSHRDTTMIAVEHSMSPLGNLIFTRDQQITTMKGIVMANMASRARHGEVDLMIEVMRDLGAHVIGRIQSPATLEGGDFFMAGDTCFIGTGLRTNSLAVQQLMDNDMIGCKYVVEVRDMFERSQDRMHLDCVFNIISYNLVMLMGSLENSSSLKRRLVNEYTQDPITKAYTLSRSDVEFSSYLRARSFHIQGIPDEFQLLYGVNCLNLGNSNIIMMHEESARLVARNPHFKGRINVVDYVSVSSMYGSLHCTSQVVRRREQTGPISRLAYTMKDPEVFPVLDQHPAALLIVPEDVALLYRNGIPSEMHASCDPQLLSLKGRDLVSIVLNELSAFHLVLQSHGLSHVHVIGREEVYFKPCASNRSISPSAYCQAFGSTLVTFHATSSLQLKAVTSPIQYAFKRMVPCPIPSIFGALDMVAVRNFAFISSKFKGSPSIIPWSLSIGIELVFLDIVGVPSRHISNLLAITSDLVFICSDSFSPGTIDIILGSLLPETRNVIEISDDQANARFCSGFVELNTNNNNKVLFISRSIMSLMSDAQKTILKETSAKTVEVSLRSSESLQIGSIRDFVTPL
uniref:Arginine deiminase n=2 Tax=Spongospora subterranea TaxID=70186 RepID=A0A0H5QLC4_9EUKA|eukprot:CRZ02793.1 hypothetical protein [Spongospora subterranea]